MTDRIELLLKSLNLSPSRFADEIDVQRSGVSHILSGRNKPSLDFVLKVLSAYPQINPDWLLFNKGSMIRKSSKEEEKIKEEEPASRPKQDPMPEQKPGKHAPPALAETGKLMEIRDEERAPYTTENPERILLLYSNGTYRWYRPG